ncbi:MAG: nucleotidyltransferase domain-containing protein [Planctomycetota bacterium]
MKKDLRDSLMSEKEIRKIIVFGSFLVSEEPNDVDVAIFQDSNETYVDLAMRYRRLTRNISRIIPVEIIPIRHEAPNNFFLTQIKAGELIYER